MCLKSLQKQRTKSSLPSSTKSESIRGSAKGLQMNMDRRDFVKILGAGGVVVLLPPSLSSCSERRLEALRPWEGPTDLGENADVRLKLVSYAILAPSAHNIQPWVVDLRGDGIGLTVDRNRLLPQTDPHARQITISQGTFLELLAIAATHYGLKSQIELFPRGIDPLEEIGTNPVAHVTLAEEEGLIEDELFNHILSRHTNRGTFGGPPLADGEIAFLSRSYSDDGYPLHLFSDPETIFQIAGMMTEAMRIESHDRSMHAETVEMLRFDDEEAERSRDGISFRNLGMSSIRLFFARLFATRISAFDESFLQKTVEMTKDAAYSSQAIGLITSHGRARVDEIMVGRYFVRTHLTASVLGLSFHPMSQVMEIESIKSQFIQALNLGDEEPQMLFRLGRAEPTPHSPRRSRGDFLRS